MIIGLVGQKGAGKDTLAREILRLRPEAVLFHFADPLKALVGILFGIPAAHMEGPEKEMPLPFPVVLDDWISEMGLVTDLEIRPAGKIARTLRELLQFFGTDYVRAARQNYWLDRTMRRVVAAPSAVVADVRFKNEADALRALPGGRVYEVVRDGSTRPPEHQSEDTAGIADEIIHNVSGRRDLLAAEAARIVARANTHTERVA